MKGINEVHSEMHLLNFCNQLKFINYGYNSMLFLHL